MYPSTTYFAVIIHAVISGFSLMCRASNAEYELSRDLLDGYDFRVRPVRHHSDVLDVSMKVVLQQIISVDSKSQFIELNLWLQYNWFDYRLQWNPEEYGGIKYLRFPHSDAVWTPDIVLHNSASDDFDTAFKSQVLVYNNGMVTWIPPGNFKALCNMDITFFPFDDQTCYLKFGSWLYGKESLNLLANKEYESAWDVSEYTTSQEWKIISLPVEHKIGVSSIHFEHDCSLFFYINLRRHSNYYSFSVILPSLILALITLLTFSLPPLDMSEKIGLR